MRIAGYGAVMLVATGCRLHFDLAAEVGDATLGDATLGETWGEDPAADHQNTTYDTYLEMGGSPKGGSTRLEIGPSYVALIRFDVDEIPVGSPILAASLTLTASSFPATNLYSVLEGWNEANASWTLRNTGMPWTAPGAGAAGSRGSVSVGSIAAGTTGVAIVDLSTAEVQRWIDMPLANHGLALVASGQETDISSSEAATGQPRLTITFATK
ncbi:MAG: DNRLRE domain-containing protein [Kofleriaceae bacterium]